MKRVLNDLCNRVASGLTAGSASADVKTREKGQVKFEGMLGRMVGMFGGKAAKEGIVTTNAVKGDRKADTTTPPATSSTSRKKRSTTST